MLALVIGVIAGIASTVQASVNTEARRFFRSPFITAGLNFMVAWLCLAAFIIFNEHALSVPVHEIAKNPPWIWLGGVCAIIIVTLNILCVPKLGAAGNVMILNFGQIVTGLVIDHFALFGAEEARMSFARLTGAVMVFVGLILVTHEKSSKNEERRSFPMLYAVLAFIDGIACSTQIAVNGTLRVVVQSVSKATIVSMSVAIISTLILITVLFVLRGRSGIFDKTDEIRPDFKVWMVSGGLFALTVVSGNAAVAPVLGTGLATIMNLIGMMASGLAIDAVGFLGIEKKPVTLQKIAGMLLMLAGTAVISFL
ncbi:MAG: DMT family transporter [Mogibacterium sp.]|nr:DMT family transporter [Mogibacterium sp.]MBQ6500346.1 DMT family transporter [Mogibacterium sp.]